MEMEDDAANDAHHDDDDDDDDVMMPLPERAKGCRSKPRATHTSYIHPYTCTRRKTHSLHPPFHLPILPEAR